MASEAGPRPRPRCPTQHLPRGPTARRAALLQGDSAIDRVTFTLPAEQEDQVLPHHRPAGGRGLKASKNWAVKPWHWHCRSSGNHRRPASRFPFGRPRRSRGELVVSRERISKRQAEGVTGLGLTSIWGPGEHQGARPNGYCPSGRSRIVRRWGFIRRPQLCRMRQARCGGWRVDHGHPLLSPRICRCSTSLRAGPGRDRPGVRAIARRSSNSRPGP